MDRSLTYFILFFNLALTIGYFIRVKNEVPLFIALFNLMVDYRVISLEAGNSRFIEYDYGINFIFNLDYAYTASNLILLGASTMIYSYILLYRKRDTKIPDNNDLLKAFIQIKKKQIIIGLCFFSLLTIFMSGSNAGGYAFLTKLGNTSFILMLFLIIVFTDKQQIGLKYFYGILFVFLTYLTYSTALRFQFLGWIIPIGFFMAKNIGPGKKIIIAVVGIFAILIVFSLAGVLRYQDARAVTTSELLDASVERLKVAEDINFIDGFMMLYQVYPNLLDYNYGYEHIEVLLRPIPRAIWPTKPQGSWVRKYQEKYNGEILESAGFSPTIWGIFYSELGEEGIVIFSVGWAWFLAFLYRAFSLFQSDLTVLLIGVLMACLIPLFRSGDMAGDFAIVLMSFWPLIIFCRQYKKFLEIRLPGVI